MRRRKIKANFWRSNALAKTPEEGKKAMGGKAARAKGHRFEREVAEKLRRIFPSVKRHLEFQREEAKGVDLDHTGPFRLQCKRMRQYCSIATINEIEHDPLCGEVPVLVTAGDGLPAMAVLPFDDLVWLLRLTGAWGPPAKLDKSRASV